MTESQLQQHCRAAYKLDQIMQAAFAFIRHNNDATEYQVKLFIRQRLKANGLVSDKDNPIVAFGSNTSHIHYFADETSAAKLEKDDLVMIDLWAKLDEKGAPYADITWMGVRGQRLASKQSTFFGHLIKARNMAMDQLKDKLDLKRIPEAGELDLSIREYFEQFDLRQHFTHTSGHTLGLSSAHGRGNGIWLKNNNPLRTNLGYTLEPGLYFDGDFGMRTEIDFYIDDNFGLMITTTPQTEIVQL